MLGLRDACFTDWQDSLLGVIEATMHDGPVYFDCFPDFTVSLSDSHILKVLTLSIITQGYKILLVSEIRPPFGIRAISVELIPA